MKNERFITEINSPNNDPISFLLNNNNNNNRNFTTEVSPNLS